jgi:probable Rubsico expression protein CbbX
VATPGLDTTGRPLDPPADPAPGGGARGFGSRDRGSPSFSDEFGGRVVRPAEGARTGSAVESVDFSGAIRDGEADVQSVVRTSRVQAVLAEMDRDLIAMQPVKRRIREIAALLVIDRLRQEMGLDSQRPTLHMSFTGNPGTGKTTVALRMASILHRLGYIDKGHLVSVTRDDLVGQYVGHTAPKTKDVVKRALGGVLFIDEAYYLHRQENERDYGQEAVEVLLQVMESERQDLVVVMAGYEDRMEEFFRANPGNARATR